MSLIEALESILTIYFKQKIINYALKIASFHNPQLTSNQS
jgi:hypothetical protein